MGDVSFQEDASGLRKGHAAENFRRVRRLALHLLKKAKACSWDHQDLLNILTQ